MGKSSMLEGSASLDGSARLDGAATLKGFSRVEGSLGRELPRGRDLRHLVESLRPPKEVLDPYKPYYMLSETERTRSGDEVSISTIFLTNKECPFRCVFCDLWRHTLDEPTPSGAIPAQIRYALGRLPPADWIKLYNNGNFFDERAIPQGDYAEIASLCEPFERVIVENHPKLSGESIRTFRDCTHAQLEIAMGVETIHPAVLERINKGCTRADMERAAEYIRSLGVDLRAFILLNPPFLTDSSEIRDWCLKSIRFAFDHGFQTVTVIPVRSGNGMMDTLLQQGLATQPDISMLLEVASEAKSWKAGRVMADLWDIEAFLEGEDEDKRLQILQNLTRLNEE